MNTNLPQHTLRSIESMGKTYKDNKDYREITKPLKANHRKLSYEEKEAIKKIKEDLHWDRLMKHGFD